MGVGSLGEKQKTGKQKAEIGRGAGRERGYRLIAVGYWFPTQLITNNPIATNVPGDRGSVGHLAERVRTLAGPTHRPTAAPPQWLLPPLPPVESAQGSEIRLASISVD